MPIHSSSFGKIEEAKEGQLAFLANPKYEDYLYSTKHLVIMFRISLNLKQPVQAPLFVLQIHILRLQVCYIIISNCKRSN